MSTVNQIPLVKKIILILLLEKIAQHFLTALFFSYNIFGLGTPDIGPNFEFNNNIMTLLNIIYGLLFILSFYMYLKDNSYSLQVIVILSVLDIVLEFLFHGIGYITVSVVIATILIILSYKDYSMKINQNYIKA